MSRTSRTPETCSVLESNIKGMQRNERDEVLKIKSYARVRCMQQLSEVGCELQGIDMESVQSGC